MNTDINITIAAQASVKTYPVFYVKELTAPKGYEKSEKIVKVEINDEGIFVDENKIEQDETEIYSFEFEDKLIEVPNTGDTRKIDKLIGIVGMSFATLMAMFIKFVLKRRKNYCNVLREYDEKF